MPDIVPANWNLFLRVYSPPDVPVLLMPPLLIRVSSNPLLTSIGKFPQVQDIIGLPTGLHFLQTSSYSFTTDKI